MDQINPNNVFPSGLSALKINLHKNWKWFLWMGIILMILGLINVSFLVWTTLISTIIFGALLLLNGLFEIIHSGHFWNKKWSGFFLHLGVGILYGLIGFLFISRPVQGAISLTLVLAVFLIVIGIGRIVLALTSHIPQRGWIAFNGLITLILGLIIWLHWPAISLWAIGIFVGIDIFFAGLWLFILGITSRKLV